MASCSYSERYPKSSNEKVFLSFYGDDWFHRFLADTLTLSLRDAGICVIRRDQLDLEWVGGGIISEEVCKAKELPKEYAPCYYYMEETNLSIALLSKEYASCYNCMEELNAVMKHQRRTNSTFLPIFYGITPAELRNLPDENCYDTVVPSLLRVLPLKQWLDVHTEVHAHSLNWSSTWNRDRSKRISNVFVKDISTRVLGMLKFGYPDRRNLVGIDNRIQDIMGLLEVDAKDVRTVWLHGMRGIGKTTLASVVYNKIADQFGEHRCFLKDIHTMLSIYRGDPWLRERVRFATIFERNHDLIKDNVAKVLLNCKEKVLVVLDGVDDVKLIDELIKNQQFGMGSRVIVTTRNLGNIKRNSGRYYKYYEVKKLDHQESLLLYRNAFNQDSVPDKLVAISSRIVEAAGGLPLAITNVASFLSSQKNDIQEGEIDWGFGNREPNMQNHMICYNALDDMQKEVFLDIACFFSGSDVRIPTHMWRDCNSLLEDHGSIKVLHLMSMIKFGDDHKVWMHHLFTQIGKAMVEQENVNEPGERSRLWGRDASLLLLDKEEKKSFFPLARSRKVKAIHLDVSTDQYVISGDRFTRLTNLQYLDLGNANLSRDSQAVVPSLRWLGWHGHAELNLLSGLTNLIVLDLSDSMINENWSGWSSLKEAKRIQVLNLSSCKKLTRTPVFSWFPSMERIILRDCSRLETIDPSISSLERLKFLDVRQCPRLRNIPNELGSEKKLELLIDEMYEVFLSFWALNDTHKAFADFLYNSLTSTGIRVCRAAPNGNDKFWEVVKRAKVSIPIISKEYVSSKWCVMNLAAMMECRKTTNQRVLPIFYDISVSEVAEEELMKQWGYEDAFAEIGTLNGWNLSDMNGSAQLIKLVVTEVSRILNNSRMVSNSFVGIDDRAEAIMRLLDEDAIDVRMVGIHGMGGIGKTTLANFIYDKISHQYGVRCFLENVRDTSSQHEGLKHLKSLLVANILGNECPDVSSVNVQHLLKRHLQNKKVLVVLDDVDQTHQITELIGDLDDSLGMGSRIIVTTRNRAVFLQSDRLYEYEVKELDQHDAFLLFCKKAFLQDSPPDKLVAISHKIVEAAGGLPLSVETIGSYLSFQEYNIWEEALDRLKTEPDIQNKLKISYNALDNKQKQIFLDVVCFFIGSDVSIPTYMWRACNLFSEAGIKVLHLMSVIKIGDDNKLWVHDQLRDLAVEIVRQENISEPGGRTRLWGKDAQIVLQNKKGTSKVVALRLDHEVGSKQSIISGDRFTGLSNLRYLDLANAQLRGNFHGLLLNLRWLGWHGSTELVIPASLDLKNIVVLDLSKSKITDKWKGWSLLKDAKKLEVLNLTSCHHLTKTPDFSQLVSVKRLILRDCIQLDTVLASIGSMENLTFLDTRNCPRLKRLPRELSYLRGLTDLLIDYSSIKEIPDMDSMLNLETLSAKSCKSLCRIPDSFVSLMKVGKVILDYCESLTEIPLSIGQLELLKELRLSHTRVFVLPDSVGDLSNLKVLNVDHCPITNLPSSLGRLRKLVEMSASHCLNLKGEFPFELDHLTSLRVLRLDHTSISSIPISISALPHLHTLDLEGCIRLRTLPKLPVSLISLKVRITSSVTVPNLPDLVGLKHLEFQRCNSLFIPKNLEKDNLFSSSFSKFEYEVFLSFRGPDSRASFTGILHERLTEVGIRTFMDTEDLRPGDEIGPNLLEAISQSKILIPIFTKGYASSKWCLMEAVTMAKCMDSGKQKVFPIFIDVAPDEVRHQTGYYAKCFLEHEISKKYDNNTIHEWRNALTKIGRQKGWDLQSSANWHQGEVIRQVVSAVLKKLKKPYLNVTDNLVGIDDHIGEVMRLLDVDKNDVRVVGIWGMGGIGKTTIAKFIYNQLSTNFEYCSFISNIRKTSQDQKGMESLQRQLVSDILRRKYEKISSIDRGISALKECLQGKKVLVLLDDVDQKEQLSSLIADLNWFGTGSRIIVTTRERQALQNCKVEWIYEVPEMQEHNAFLLFCKHAFRQESPTPDFANLSWNIVAAAGGLPLAIEIIASYLSFHKREEVWEEALDKLKTASGVHTILKISYDSLSYEQQEIFLDVSCLFNGMDRRILSHIWKARHFTTPASAIQDLCLRALIKITDDNTLWMHDILRDLGKEIVRQKGQYELGKQSRLWCSKDAMEVLKNKKGTEYVQAIYLGDGNDSNEHSLNSKIFEKLPNLMFLGLHNAKLMGNFRGCLSNLRWLSWHGGNLLHRKTGWWPEYMNLRSSLLLKELVILDLSNSMIYGTWGGWNSFKESTNLEVLNLSSCHQLKRTPNFSTFLHMNRLILEDCKGLVEIDPSIGDLKMLEFLDMRNCSSLKMIPYKEFGYLVALTELLIDECPIEELPISGGMQRLRIVSAKSCRLLTKIPSSIEFLVSLTKLLLNNCTSLVDIPSTIGHLESLRELSLSHTGVVYLPDSIQNLRNLEVLHIDHCPIRTWPVSLVKLGKLEVLNASGCRILTGDIPSELESMSCMRILRLDHTSVNSIPKGIVRLSHLHTLDLKECTKLRSLPNLPSSLVVLRVTCTTSVIVPNIAELVNLKQLDIILFGASSHVPKDIDKFSKIEKLTITIK